MSRTTCSIWWHSCKGTSASSRSTIISKGTRLGIDSNHWRAAASGNAKMMLTLGSLLLSQIQTSLLRKCSHSRLWASKESQIERKDDNWEHSEYSVHAINIEMFQANGYLTSARKASISSLVSSESFPESFRLHRCFTANPVVDATRLESGYFNFNVNILYCRASDKIFNIVGTPSPWS